MKIQNIYLSWFRGAGESIDLNTAYKSVVIYGENGSGKSSFADALEYVIMKGKVGHLKHEYSGAKQEKGIINTHKPSAKSSNIRIIFDGDVFVNVDINTYGNAVFSGNPKDFIGFLQSLPLENFLLRQDEVANFISGSKGNKYSVLLPLLGMNDFDQAADNLNKLITNVSDVSYIITKRYKLTELYKQLAKYFDNTNETTLREALNAISNRYKIDIKGLDVYSSVAKLHKLLMDKVNSLEPDIARYTIFKKVDEQNLTNRLSDAVAKQNKIRDKVDELLDIRLEILQYSDTYSEKNNLSSFQCPSCGAIILKEKFVEHVKSELLSLKAIREDRNLSIQSQSLLKKALDLSLEYMDDKHVQNWLKEDAQSPLKDSIEVLKGFIKNWDHKLSSETQLLLNSNIPIIADIAKIEAGKLPPSNSQLIEDLDILTTINSIQGIKKLENNIKAIDQLLSSLSHVETEIRKTTRIKTESIIAHISTDVQYLWSKLHPGQPIEHLKLYIPEEDKAIDIGLKFYGVEQLSPRLTLSEGHRNSLGLCIFLAIARYNRTQFPIILDDIVSSLDRGHRGNVTSLLAQDFNDRQIIIFTHDREWFQELKVFLPGKSWKTLILKPWITPDIGMQWSLSENTFDDAKALIQINCNSAGNCTRAIMDTFLGIFAEKLRIKMNFLRGDHNDHRTCIEFIENIISASKSAFKKKVGDTYESYPDPIPLWQEVRKELIIFGDRSSHGGTLVPDEANSLIEICERCIEAFKCPECNSYIWTANQEGKGILQCSCGNLHWKYE